jgi:exopolysaccharide biosynthesis WecB/TagA/CpsF family protein
MSQEQVLGLRFFCGSPLEAVEKFTETGGYMVIPASPALIKLRHDQDYRSALQNADLVLADSGLLAALWRLVAGGDLRRISGIAYLRCLLERSEIRRPGNSFWVVASETAKTKAIGWLRKNGFQITPDSFHVGSQDNAAQDHELLLKIEQQRPNHILIALGAETQEKLGLYLREYLLYRPCIHCIGAALGFLSGVERPIPDWAERLRLGWMLRLAAQPRMLLPRIGIAFILAEMLFKYRSEMPPLKKRWAEM